MVSPAADFEVLTEMPPPPDVVAARPAGAPAVRGEVIAPAVEGEPGGFERLDAAAIFAPLPAVDWTCQAIDLAPGAPSMIAGYGYSKKTLAAQALALAVAGGTTLWERWPVAAGRVLHLDYEQGFRLTAERYQRLARAAGLDAAALQGQLDVACFPDIYLDSPGAEEVYARELDGHRLAIVDSLRAAAPRSDENESGVRRVLDMLARASERTGCTCLVVHHARKPSAHAVGGAKMAIRGSGALFDACQSVLVLEAEQGDEPSNAGHVKARLTGHLAAPFMLRAEDVLGDDGDERWGLRVIAEDADTYAEAAREAELNALTDHVLGVVRANPQASTRLVCEQARRRYGRVVAALEMLERGGAIKNLADGRRGAKWAPILTSGGAS